MQTLIEPKMASTDTGDDLIHAVCPECWPDVDTAEWALCGRYVGDAPYSYLPYNEDEADSCVLCSLTDICTVCGEKFVG